jgi:serine protease Do
VKDRKGALVSEVQPDSPAAKAGLRSGDVVVAWNGKKVEDPGDLARAVGLAKPDQEGTLTVVRDGAERKLAVRLGSQPGERTASRLGLDVRPVTPDVARELGLDAADGVVVASVERGSAGERAGVRRGDVIREIDRKPVKSVADFERLTRTLPAERPVTVRIERGGGTLYVALAPPKAEG